MFSSPALKTEELRLAETLVASYHSTWHHISQERNSLSLSLWLSFEFCNLLGKDAVSEGDRFLTVGRNVLHVFWDPLTFKDEGITFLQIVCMFLPMTHHNIPELEPSVCLFRFSIYFRTCSCFRCMKFLKYKLSFHRCVSFEKLLKQHRRGVIKDVQPMTFSEEI